MSGYDALDELYERLREAEDAPRAGGITPETIRAARGGVADEIGRVPATAAESAARADSAPLADISRDSRERIEADAWEAARLDMSRTWEERRDAIVALLDRQAALTEREWDSATANERIAELQDDNDRLQDVVALLRVAQVAHRETHMKLPLDADGVPIRVGDVVDSGLDSGKVLRLELWSDGWVVVFDVGCGNTSRYESTALRHVETPDSWERICADLRAMDAGNLIALGNGQYVEDTRHDEIAARIERMAKS